MPGVSRSTHQLILGALALGVLVLIVVRSVQREAEQELEPDAPREQPAHTTESASAPVRAEPLASPQAERSQAAAPVPATQPEPPRASWTLRFEGSQGEELPELEASVGFWRGEASEHRELPTGSLDDGVRTWILDVSAWENARARVSAAARGFAPFSQFLPVRAGESHTIALEAGASVVGRVLDGGGAPVQGADVRLRAIDANGDRTWLCSGHSDEDGRFQVGTIASGMCELSAEHDQLGVSLPLRRELALHEHWEAGDLRLRGEAEVFGRVLFPNGAPVDDIRLHAERQEEAEHQLGLARSQLHTDAQGAFHFTGLSPGSVYQVEHGLRAVAPFGADGRARAGGTEVLLVLNAGRVIVRAVDEGGSPVAIQSVAVVDVQAEQRVSAETWAAAQDSATLFLPAVRPYRIGAQDAAGRSYEGLVELVAGETERELQLRPPATGSQSSLRLVLLDPEGEPLTRYQVTLTGGGTGGWTHRSAPEDLVDGAFRDLAPGPCELRVRLSRLPGGTDLYLAEETRAVELFPGRETRLEVSCERGGRVELDLGEVPKLQDRHAAALSGRPAVSDEADFRALHVFRRSGDSITSATTAELGLVWQTEHPMQPGSWVLRLQAEGYLPWEQAVLVRAGELTKLRVALEPE